MCGRTLPVDRNCWQGPPSACSSLRPPAQMRVIGASMGAWGKEKYGMKPKKVEALEFLQ